MKCLKIAIFHPRFDRVGGAEFFIVKNAEELRKRGHKVDVYAIRVNPIFKGIKQLSSVASCRIFRNLAIDFVGINLLGWSFLKALKKSHYDIINPHHYPAPLISVALKKLGFTKAKIVWMCHGPKGLLYQEDKSYLGFSRWGSKAIHYFVFPLRWFDQWSIRNVNTVISNSENTQRKVRQIYGRESFIVNPGVDSNLFDPEKIDINEYRTEKKCLLAVGRLVTEKNFDFLIRAFKKVVSLYPGVILKIVGSGPEEGELHSLIESLALKEYVELLTSVPQEKLAKLYAACDLFVHPMKDETWGMVIIEAMAMGKPVVAIDSAGPKEIVIDGQTGYLVKPSLVAFAEKINELLASPQEMRRMGKEGRKRVMDNFSWEKSAQRMEELFCRIGAREK